MSTSRRDFLRTIGAGLAATVSVPATAGAASAAIRPVLAAGSGGQLTGPPTVTGDDVRFTPDRTLSSGSPGDVGLLAEHVGRIVPSLTAYLDTTPENPDRPMYAGAVVLAAKDGVVVEHSAMGHALRYADIDGTELPHDQWVAAETDTIFDLASVTKLFCTVVILQLIEDGAVGLDTPAAHYVPEFAENGKDQVTVRQLLTHTAGLPAWLPLHSGYDTPEERIAAVYAADLQNPPGTQYVYSDIGLITLGKLAERVAGASLDQLVAERIAEPLGMTDTMFNPPESLHHRVAATEDMSSIGRGIVRGEVHDENAWSLNGVAGHAGLFSTAADLAVFSQMLLNGGEYGGERILSEDIMRQAITNQNDGLPPGSEARRGLGFELHKPWYMASIDSPVTFGHTGFTGTSLVIDPLSSTFVVLLTNRVHPDRGWGSNNLARQAAARHLGRAMPVSPAVGRTAWYSGQPHDSTHTLTVPFSRPADHGPRVSFRLWYDTEAGFDVGRLEASSDEGESWDQVPFDLEVDNYRWSSDGTFSGFQGRQWVRATAGLPAGTTHLRWSYTGERSTPSRGRGVYVDGVRVTDRRGALFNGQRPADAARVVLDGWTESAN
ncbi:serine hydrolase domain-containing protein [Phytoactinopolyspora mesophila]|uniref:Serine hydrolase n=1 Tax=Phytoactinopolyspora mesophila TaxID=2650750 RepID=A0A7K3M351_9ACTN|nr:serine hydrolase domain-containing protein [Phytoactinopolyspora mesophila]NDL57352.1 serine hydrolase [Phytoactinopolyspora mesophila]